MDFLRYTFEIVACCCGTWLRFLVSLVGLSLFLLVAVVVSTVVFGARALPCRVDTESRTSLLLVEVARHATRAEVLFGLALCYSFAHTSQDEATRKFVRHIVEFYFLALSAQRTIRLRKPTWRGPTCSSQKHHSCWRQTPPTPRKCCSSQGSLVKEIYVVRSTGMAMSEGLLFSTTRGVTLTSANIFALISCGQGARSLPLGFDAENNSTAQVVLASSLTKTPLLLAPNVSDCGEVLHSQNSLV